MKNLLRIKFMTLFLLSVFIGCITAYAQEIYDFKTGLSVVSPHSYGREALYTDNLLWQLYNTNLKKPVEGGYFGQSEKGDSLIWQPVMADSANRLRGSFRRGGFGRGGGYIYLTYTSDKEKTALLNIKGNSGILFNGEPHAGDPYSSGWLYIPLRLKKGLNEFYVRGLFITASLSFPKKPVIINTEDPTLPDIILTENNSSLKGAIVIINTSSKELQNYQIKSRVEGKEVITGLPAIPPMSTRKVSFDLNAEEINSRGKHTASLVLANNGKPLDETTFVLNAVNPSEQYSTTFTSAIDGSLQYYAVTPQTNFENGAALFLSVHGAGVEAIGQARAYKPKEWGTLVAATNRRPRGFNWEDWGRIDALEVLGLAKEKFKPHPQHIYLTGHSMGGHGTWFLGATYPDKWAAIAPCAGYPTLKGYGSADGLIPDSSRSLMEKMLLRSSNQSDMIQLATNYKPFGVYIFHGDEDRVVSVNYARQMKKILSDFHPDMSYYEYPGGSHWFGDHSVDWKPLFDFFKWHKKPLDSTVNTIDFMTASPGISSSFYWTSIEQQIHPLAYSRLRLNRNKVAKTIIGSTENIRLLKLHLEHFSPGSEIKITLDSLNTVGYKTIGIKDSIFLLKESDQWIISQQPDLFQKGPHRYGTFKDGFNNRMIFVYSSIGTKEENTWSFNKARYDAETWYYRGNGAVDIISDKDFSLEKYSGRGVILYGNANSNAAWKILLNDCPIQVQRNQVIAGDKVWKGEDLAAYFVWPIRNSPNSSVAVISGTGIKGMNAATANQYFAGASGFPDFVIYGLDMLHKGADEVKMAGFFDHNWKLNPADFIQAD